MIVSSIIRRILIDRLIIRGKRFNFVVGGIMLFGKIGRIVCYNRVIECGYLNDRIFVI